MRCKRFREALGGWREALAERRENAGLSTYPQTVDGGLAVVRLASLDAERAVDLLEQDDARHLVRERHRPEREALVGAGEHVGAEPGRPTDRECDVAAPVERELPEPLGERLGGQPPACDLERDDVSAGTRDGADRGRSRLCRPLLEGAWLK